jgi:hypothetical protein
MKKRNHEVHRIPHPQRVRDSVASDVGCWMKGEQDVSTRSQLP